MYTSASTKHSGEQFAYLLTLDAASAEVDILVAPRAAYACMRALN